MKDTRTNSYQYRDRFLGWGSGPDADWRVMFSVFCLLLLASTIASTLMFMNVRNSDPGIGDNSQKDPLLDREALRNTANFYEQKKVDFESFRTLTETSPDPSI